MMGRCTNGLLVGLAAERIRSAFSLVEVVVAIGIISIGLLALLALLPVGMNSIQQGKTEEIAVELLNATALEFRSIPTGTNSLTPLRKFNLSPDEIVQLFDHYGRPRAPTDDTSYFRLRATRRSTPSTRGDWWHLRLEWPAAAATPTGYLDSLVLVPSGV
jgi:uncharacterized protein (TIGR02598 family)